MTSFARVALVAALLLVGCGSTEDPQPDDVIDLSEPDAGELSPSGRTLLDGFTEVLVVMIAPDGTRKEFCFLLADDTEEWSHGLMQVVDLGAYEGMVFAFREDRTGTFFMRNTPTPLSITFLDDAGGVVSATDMEPCEDRDGCPSYAADGPYRTAIEVPQERRSALGLDEPGIEVELAGACRPV